MFAFYLSDNKRHDLGKARTTGHHFRQWRSGCVPNQSWWAALRGSKWRSYLCSDKWSCLVSVFFNALLVFSLSAIIKTLKFLSRSSGSESQTCWEASCGNVTGWSISEPLATHLWPEECKNIHTGARKHHVPTLTHKPIFQPKKGNHLYPSFYGKQQLHVHILDSACNTVHLLWVQSLYKPLQNNM